MNFRELKKAVEAVFGRPILNRPDCEALSTAVFIATKDSISYNTLRRFYALAGEKYNSKLSQTTLDILARYCGYPCYSAFESDNSVLTAISNYYRLQLNLQQKENFTLSEIENYLSQISDEHQKYNFTHAAILQAFKQNNLAFIKKIFQLQSIFSGQHYLNSNLYFLIQSIGIQLRQQPQLSDILWKYWAQDEQARFYYFELFVDMDHLVTRHYKGIEYYAKYANSDQDKLFSSSLLAWRAWLIGDSKLQKKHVQIIESISNLSQLHPIPVARSLNIRLVLEWQKNASISNSLLTTLNQIRESFSHHEIPFFEMWMCEGLFMTQHFELLKEYINTIRTRTQNRNDYHLLGTLQKINWIEYLILNSKKEHFSKETPNETFDKLDIYSKDYDSLFYYARFKKLSTRKVNHFQQLGLIKLFDII